MSDPKRATLITVGAPKSAKNNVNKTVRLSVNLDESNESKYPELNYKELLITAARKKKVENGKTTGLDPFSDNDDDVERVARKFEQKYGGKSTYGRKGRSKDDDFADIGAGYDENDSFIDNTHGYDEMIPPGCDTFHGGFYINCGSLEFMNVPENQSAVSDGEPNRRNKRRISSSSSEEESSDSSSESEDSREAKDPKAIANGEVDSHKTEHRKKKNKNIDKKKAKKIRRTDSSAATSGKQTSDDNVHGDAESADSRTSQSDSVASKPAPSSENAITSDSSRDAEAKVEVKLPDAVREPLDELDALAQQARDNPSKDTSKTDHCIVRLHRALSKGAADAAVRRAAWSRAAKTMGVSRTKLMQRAKDLKPDSIDCDTATPLLPISEVAQPQVATTSTATSTATIATSTTSVATHKRKADSILEPIDISTMTPEEKEAKIVETLERLKVLIEERKPGMMATYNAECERVQEERKKIQIASVADGAPHIDKRLPKRRFPWCPRSRALLSRLAALAGEPDAAAALLANRALKLFPAGFVRMPTLLRQADLNKEIKATEVKRQRLGSTSQSVITSTQQFNEPILFPSSLTVTTTVKNADKTDSEKEKYKVNPAAVYNTVINSIDLSVEKPDDRKKDTDRSKEDMYIPPNNIGSITITPVPNQKDKKANNVSDKTKEPLIRVKSPAALNESVIHKKDKDKHKKIEAPKEQSKRVDTLLHVDTTNHNKKEPTQSPKSKEEFSKKQIESMRIAESNIPRPALVSVHHSPTFAKPDKRPPEVKKKKDILIISDMDPLADIPQEPVPVDDSSSDVEVVEEKSDKSELKSVTKSDLVPLKDKLSDNHKKVNHKSESHKNSVKVRSEKSVNSKDCRKKVSDEPTMEDIDSLMRDISEMKNSQEPTRNCNSYGGVITSAKHESSKQSYNRPAIIGEPRTDKDKLTNFFKENGWI